MTADMECGRVRELAPELALDIVDGEDRDAILRHLSVCAECRRFTGELSSLSDELLPIVGPAHEPGGGFESRVLGALAEEWKPRARPQPAARKWRLGAAVAASIIMVTLGAATVFVFTSEDRRLAQNYRATLEEGRGSFFAAAPLLQGTGGRAGTVFAYEGNPSWVMVTRDPSEDDRRLRAQVVTRHGRYIELGTAVFEAGSRTWGRSLPLDLSAVHELRFLGAQGQVEFAAKFGAVDPWE